MDWLLKKDADLKNDLATFVKEKQGLQQLV
jgi:hypothetical protein